jgi:tape measure domain-containing protein
MANLATVTIQFKSSGAQQVAQQTNQLIQFANNLATRMGVAVTASELAANAILGLGNALKNMAVASFQSGLSLDKNIRTLALYQTNAKDLSAQLERLFALSKQPGLGLNQVLQGVTYLQAAGFSATLAEKAVTEFGNALTVAGKGQDDLQGVFLALGQIKSKGIISAEEINQIAERIPQIRTALVKAFGTGNTKAIQEMQITAKEFVERIVKQLENIPRATLNVEQSLAKLDQSFKTAGGIAALGFFKLFENQKSTNTIQELDKAVINMGENFNRVFSSMAQSPAVQQLQTNILTIIQNINKLAPVITGIFGAVMVYITAAFKTFTDRIVVISTFLTRLFSNPLKLIRDEFFNTFDFIKNHITNVFTSIGDKISIFLYKLKEIMARGNLGLANIGIGDKAQREKELLEARIELGNVLSNLSLRKYLPTKTPLILEAIRAASPTSMATDFLGNLAALSINTIKNMKPFNILPNNLQFGKKKAGEDDPVQKAAKKNQKALDLIVINTKRTADLTLRNLTYGGGELAAQGLSSVQMQNSKTYGRATSSPVINATNDITRGVEKIVRGYSGSNNLNFNFRRS